MGKLKPFEQSSKPTRTWLAIAIEKPHPSLDIHQPATLITAVVAMRSDMVKIRLEVAMFIDKLKLLPRQEDVATQTILTIRNAIDQLEDFRECPCKLDKPCQKHQPPRVH